MLQLMRGIFFPTANMLFNVQTHDPALKTSRALMGTRMWTAGTVPQADVALGAPTGPPLVNRLARHAVLGGDLADLEPADHQLDDVAPRSQGQSGISVNVHEGLLEKVRIARQLHTYSWRPSLLVDPDVNNVRGHHT